MTRTFQGVDGTGFGGISRSSLHNGRNAVTILVVHHADGRRTLARCAGRKNDRAVRRGGVG
jgi:hypothetical protein